MPGSGVLDASVPTAKALADVAKEIQKPEPSIEKPSPKTLEAKSNMLDLAH